MTSKTATTPYYEEWVTVSPLHQVYFACYGNAKGMPVLFVHGGPGGGTSATDTAFFNLEHYHVILVDQRGCGKSLPLAELEENTTTNLIADFELIRNKLNIEKWMLFGGSWGSTLSLLYAQQHPKAVTHLILRGIFLGLDSGTNWICQEGGASRIWPEYWEELVNAIPNLSASEKPLSHLYQMVTHDDEQIRKQTCEAFAKWEGSISKHEYNKELVNAFATWPLSYSIGRLELHYMYHQFFIQPNQIIDQCHKIGHIPLNIVHGRYDIICPVDQAYLLYQTHKQLNQNNTTSLTIIDNAGHSASEKGIANTLKALTDTMIP